MSSCFQGFESQTKEKGNDEEEEDEESETSSPSIVDDPKVMEAIEQEVNFVVESIIGGAGEFIN